jgi:hypothetical protein
MTRLITMLAAGAVLWAGLALHPARAGPPSAPPPPAAQSAPELEAVAPLQLAPPPGRKPHGGGGSAHSGASAGNVIRGSDTISLVAILPWWRPDDSRPPDLGEFESPVLTACDVWLGFPFATGDAQSLTVRLAAAQTSNVIDLVANHVRVVDAGELNEIDLTAPEEPHRTDGPLLGGLLAILGGGLAVFLTLRYLAGARAANASGLVIQEASRHEPA